MSLDIQLQTGVPAASPHASSHEKGGDDGIATLGNLAVDSLTTAGDVDTSANLKADTIAEHTAATGVTIDGVLLKDSEVTTDVINEKTAAAGVTIDSVLLKDGDVKVAGGLVFVRADKDSDGDYDPLTAAAWEDSTKSGTGTINWNTVFGVPAAAKAVLALTFAVDATVGSRINFFAKSTTTNVSYQVRIFVANVQQAEQFVIPIAADGTSYYAFLETFDGLFLRVIGWYL